MGFSNIRVIRFAAFFFFFYRLFSQYPDISLFSFFFSAEQRLRRSHRQKKDSGLFSLLFFFPVGFTIELA